ncbi:MAG: PEP-utilizing enzyme [Phycisphaerales bacterium]|nr:PEP-utilizing enzyme [Phycisphaerales bacterium]
MTGPYILSLSESTEVRLVGGKAINLAALIRAGFPVPDGFVITTAAFHAAASDNVGVEAAIRERYCALGGKAVAVRSSATAEDMAGASMAGQYETYLDIVGEDAVIEAVKKCWASVSTARTQAYLREHGIDPADVAMAVVVQELVPAEVAGVMFTANPRTGDEREILIEASYGLGEAVVSGLVQPDTIVLDGATGAVKSYVIGTKEVAIHPSGSVNGAPHGNAVVEHRYAHPAPEEQRKARCLADSHLTDLFALAHRVAAHFQLPQDTEWAISKDGKLYLLQSRAVTTLAAARQRTALIEEHRKTLTAAKQQGRGDWAQHNLGETLPQPTPLTWSILQRFMTPAGGFGKMYALAGYEPSQQLNPEGFLELIAGRIYMDLSRAPEMFFAEFPFRYDTELLRATPSAAQGAPTIPCGSVLTQFRIGRKLRRVGQRLAELARDLDTHLDYKLIPEFRQWIRLESQVGLSRLDVEEWLEVWQWREKRIMDEFAPWSLLPSLICGMALENLRSFLSPHVWDQDPAELADMLAAGGPEDATMRSNDALYRVASGTLPLEAWLLENGHRGPEEFDLAAPRWRERSEAARALAKHLLGGARPEEEHRQRQQDANQRIAELKTRLRPREQRELDERVTLCRRYLRFREDGKHELMRGYELLRHMVLDAARRLNLPPADVCLLTFPELAAALRPSAPGSAGGSPSDVIKDRRARRTAESRIALPDVIDEKEIERFGELQLPSHTNRLTAFPLSSGHCLGPVRIVASPESAEDLGRDYILVCRSTDPSWTPLFVNAAGIVLECGGTLSHGAVVAREMGKPAVVLPNATQLLTENQQIAVDGTLGAVMLAGEEPITTSGEIPPDPNDMRIAWDCVPPVAGRRERTSSWLRNICLLLWGVFLGLVFLLPQTQLYEASMAALDQVLWPLVRSLGGPITVAIIAASLAILSMIGQWLLCDTPRLREAKRRAALLRQELASLPLGSPRGRAIASLAAPVQMRLTLAAFVPLAVLLGPMVMSFLWLPERIDPAVQNPRPGATAIISASIDTDYAGPITLTADPALQPAAESQTATPIRPVLTTLVAQLQRGEVPPAVRSLVAQDGKSPEFLATDLQKFLQIPPHSLPPQTLSWSILTPPETAAIYHVTATAANGQTLTAPLVLGDLAPPPAAQTDEKGNRFQQIIAVPSGSPPGPILAFRIRYADTRRVDAQAFFAPFAPLGWHYDFGWLGIYLIVYMAVLFPTRWLLRIP